MRGVRGVFWREPKILYQVEQCLSVPGGEKGIVPSVMRSGEIWEAIADF